MRTYDVLYSIITGWAVIFRDDTDKNWYVLETGLSETSARMMVRGAEA